jgi:hypothetical protein
MHLPYAKADEDSSATQSKNHKKDNALHFALVANKRKAHECSRAPFRFSDLALMCNQHHLL